MWPLGPLKKQPCHKPRRKMQAAARALSWEAVLEVCWHAIKFLWKESLNKWPAQGGADRLQPLQPRGRRQGSGLAIMRCLVSSDSASEPIAAAVCVCCCGEGGRFHPPLVLSVAWGDWWGDGRPRAWSRVENSWMLPLQPQRMFRAHIRCDQMMSFLLCGKKWNTSHNTMESQCVHEITICLVWQGNKHVLYSKATLCFGHAWELCADRTHGHISWRK